MSAGYFAVVVNTAYTLATVPLALHYLGREWFGLWVLVQQISGYLLLLDFGVTSALARFIADYKDEINDGEYGKLLLTGFFVFSAQGVLIAALGLCFSIFAPSLFAIAECHSFDFRNVLIIMIFITGFSVATRCVSAPLWAFQRTDIIYFMGILSLVISFVGLWIGFHFSLGIYSLAVSAIPGALLSPLIAFYCCKKNGFYPSIERGWIMPTYRDFQHIFIFGKDAALMSLGSQMANASQIMVISRFVGLDTAATFSIGTKLYSLGQQLVARIIGTAAPGLTELFVRGETTRFNTRFLHIISISTFLSTLFALFLICANSIFISIWTSGIICWDQWADFLLGFLLVITGITRCLTELFVFRGSLKTVRHIYLIEGLLSLALSIPAVSCFGLTGLLASAFFAHLVATFFSTFRAVVNTGFSVIHIRRLIINSFLIIIIIFILTKIHFFDSAWPFFSIILYFSLGALMGWRFLLDETLRTEIVNAFWIKGK